MPKKPAAKKVKKPIKQGELGKKPPPLPVSGTPPDPGPIDAAPNEPIIVPTPIVPAPTPSGWKAFRQGVGEFLGNWKFGG